MDEIKLHQEKESPLQNNWVVQDKSFIHAARKANLSWQKFSTFVTRKSQRFRHAVNCLVQGTQGSNSYWIFIAEEKVCHSIWKVQAGIIPD